MYYKGANLLHTIRQLIGDDEKWRQILRGINKDFYHQTVITKQIEDYISQKSGMDLSKVFDQYLRTANIPVFEYKVSENELQYRYTNVVDGFDMPLEFIGKVGHTIKPTAQWQTKKLTSTVQDIIIDRDYYVNSKKLN